jgi:hypothetical protein
MKDFCLASMLPARADGGSGRSPGLISNLPRWQCEQTLRDSMTKAAAIDRLVHPSIMWNGACPCTPGTPSLKRKEVLPITALGSALPYHSGFPKIMG